MLKGVVEDYGIEKTIVNNKTLILPPENTYTFTWILPPIGFSFNAYWYIALYDAETNEKLSEDYAYWFYKPTTYTEGIDISCLFDNLNSPW